MHEDETPGQMLHRLIHAYWGTTPPIDDDGDYFGLRNSAIEGWEHIASQVLENGG